MEKEIIDIIDTAVKIGLGATISGMSAYYLSKLNFSRNNIKDKRDKTISLLEDIAFKIEASKHKLNESSKPYWHFYVEPESISHKEATKQSLNIIMEASALIGQASALANLLQITELISTIDKVEKIIEEMYEVTGEDEIVEKSNNLNALLEKAEPIYTKCFTVLGNTYNNA